LFVTIQYKHNPKIQSYVEKLSGLLNKAIEAYKKMEKRGAFTGEDDAHTPNMP
jgi:hypothetical protein